MPWPATHIIIAESCFDSYFTHLNRRDFMIGTSFPDIRYPSKLDRSRTHIQGVPLTTIQSQPSFEAGLLFHGYVDDIWNKYIHMNGRGLFAEIPHSLPMLHAMKVLQDRYLYTRGWDWEQVTQYFQSILPEELAFGIPEKMVQRWHIILSHYLSKPSDIEDLEMLKLSLPKPLIGEIARCFHEHRENPLLEALMVRFYDHFDMLMA